MCFFQLDVKVFLENSLKKIILINFQHLKVNLKCTVFLEIFDFIQLTEEMNPPLV